MDAYSWVCPHCQRAVTITTTDHSDSNHVQWLSEFEFVQLTSTFVKCPNPDCNEIAVSAELSYGQDTSDERYVDKKSSRKWNLVPGSKAKSYPDYVPKAIIEDYTEACLIADLSPKASATLSRRCMQGMIHDFWGISKGNLGKEIEALQDKLDAETHAAINAVRSIGNIGAHMEKDINVIVDVEPHEAELLIQLIETLISEWYVNREERKRRMSSVVGLAATKREQKEAAKAEQ